MIKLVWLLGGWLQAQGDVDIPELTPNSHHIDLSSDSLSSYQNRTKHQPFPDWTAFTPA